MKQSYQKLWYLMGVLKEKKKKERDQFRSISQSYADIRMSCEGNN